MHLKNPCILWTNALLLSYNHTHGQKIYASDVKQKAAILERSIDHVILDNQQSYALKKKCITSFLKASKNIHRRTLDSVNALVVN